VQVPDSSGGGAPRARRPRRGARVLVVVALGASLAGCAATAGSPSSKATDSAKYGSLPAFLPPASFDTDRVLVGTTARPALTTEGDAVSTGSGGALVTVSGPEVPGEGLPYQADAPTCTWTVTIRAGSAPVRLSAADFSSIDHRGAVYQPTLVPGESDPPSLLRPHERATFELRTVMVVGEGLMRWAPDGTHIVAEWDFEVEND
jgi:hypothetical protein